MWHRKLSFIFLCHCFIVQVSKLHSKKLLATLLDRQEVLNIPKMVQFRNFSNPTQNDWGNFVRKKNVTTNEFPCLVENWFFFFLLNWMLTSWCVWSIPILNFLYLWAMRIIAFSDLRRKEITVFTVYKIIQKSKEGDFP